VHRHSVDLYRHPLDDPQIQLLCTRWHDAGLLDDRARDRVRARIPEVRELMRSPLVATLILVLARHGEIPRTRQRLLSEVLALVVDRWPKHRELLLDAPARAAFLRHLAWSMLTTSAHGNEPFRARRPPPHHPRLPAQAHPGPRV